MKKHEFVNLQKRWYKKLADSGFKDIENPMTGDLSSKEAQRNYRRDKMPQDLRVAQADYFFILSQLAFNDDTFFRNDAERYILMRYSEGTRICDIVKELIERQTPRERKTIRFIIRRYEMAWGLKYYSRKELNLK